jgi:hypothetical protein
MAGGKHREILEYRGLPIAQETRAKIDRGIAPS